ncbi:MAG: glycosyltransferase family 4 protein [Alphaproteobacteria bacterium]
MQQKLTILHISSDYPDCVKPDKTKAINNLVEAVPEYHNVVYSLNRITGWKHIESTPFGKHHTAIIYAALPKGLFWLPRLQAVAEYIYADLTRKNITPALIHTHKFTVEGIIGHALARRFGCKLICSIQGGTDVKILKFKPSLHEIYTDIASYASHIFSFAPWATLPFIKQLGLDDSKSSLLPALPAFDALRTSESRGSQKLVTCLRWDTRKNKNLAGIMNAIRQLVPKYPNISLDIYGGDSPENMTRLRTLIEKSSLSERINLKGAVPNHTFQNFLGQYAAQVTPSFSETYGLVFAEALFCGVPVLFSKGRAIDGYFDTSNIGYACNPTSAQDIAHGIDHIFTHENRLKESITAMQQNGSLDAIRRDHIIRHYRHVLASCMPETLRHAA